MTLLTDDELAEIARRAERATPGPWQNSSGFVRSSGSGGSLLQGDGYTIQTSTLWVAECRDGEAFYNPDGNAAFIAASRTDVPALLAHIAEQARALEECRKASFYMPPSDMQRILDRARQKVSAWNEVHGHGPVESSLFREHREVILVRDLYYALRAALASKPEKE